MRAREEEGAAGITQASLLSGRPADSELRAQPAPASHPQEALGQVSLVGLAQVDRVDSFLPLCSFSPSPNLFRQQQGAGREGTQGAVALLL